MGRYIDAEAYIEKYECCGYLDEISVEKFNKITSTADVVEVVHGEWVKDEEKSKKLIESIYICSACHNFEAWGETEKYNYCPNCGAKMDAERREDEQIH